MDNMTTNRTSETPIAAPDLQDAMGYESDLTDLSDIRSVLYLI
jgi:hypothetical protein